MEFIIGFSRPKKFRLFSFLTMWVEDTEFSHVYVSWKDPMNLRWVAEAKGSGVRMLSNIEFRKNNEIIDVYKFSTDLVGRSRVIHYAHENMGKCYGFLQIIGLLEMRIRNKLNKIFNLRNKTHNRYANGMHSQICTEYALNTYEAVYNSLVVSPENWGLKEIKIFLDQVGHKLNKEKINQINGV